MVNSNSADLAETLGPSAQSVPSAFESASEEAAGSLVALEADLPRKVEP